MSSRKEWFANKLAELLKEELRVSTLSEINDHLQSLPTNEVKSTVDLLDVPLVFDCLNVTNNEQIDLACNILSICFDNLSIEVCSKRYSTLFDRALGHPYPAVKLMVLKELERDVKDEDILIDLCKRNSLLALLVRCLACEIEVASKSSKILVVIGCSDAGIQKLTSSELVKSFSEVMAVNDTVRLRVFDVIVDISKLSKSSFHHLESTGLITPFLKDLDSPDILYKMNVIEILSQLGSSDYGFEYLESNGVISQLCFILKKGDLIDLQLCEPGILRFFGKIGYFKPNIIIEKYSYVLIRMVDIIRNDGSDFSVVGVSLDTIGYIGSTTNGKYALDILGLVENCMFSISQKLGTFPTDITVRALKCIGNLLHTDENQLQISFISQKWFLALGENAMINIVLKYAKNPFLELRLAGLLVINSFSNQIWGQELIKDTPGLIEFILDRNVETHKECKELKYQIVKKLSSSSVFDSLTVNRLKNYINEGAFYVQGVIEVAFEENN